MLAWIEPFLIRYPELTLFLVIAVGYWIGGFKAGAFSLGPVTGALFAGLLVGQFAHVPVSGMTKSFLFLLFLFGIGYSVGPQFIPALKNNGFKPIALVVLVCFTGLAAAIVIARTLGLDPGFAAGLMSGALTQSAAMGTATDAINGLPLTEAERARLVAHVAVADAVTYIFGYAGVIIFLTSVAPALLGVDLKEEALKLERELGMDRAKPGLASAWRKFDVRAFRLPEDSLLIGLTVDAAEARAKERRLFVVGVRRGEELLEIDPRTVLQAGDIVAISGARETMVALTGAQTAEVEDRELLDIPVMATEILLSNPELAGRSLSEMSGEAWSRGLYLRSASRGGQDLPLAAGLVLQSGDLLRVVGPVSVVQAAAPRIGVVVDQGSAIDFVVMGLAIFLGGVAGVLLTFTVGSVTISVSTSVGVLLAGLLVGHLRTRHVTFGRISDGAVSLMTSLGLAAFVGLTGLHAGPNFVPALKEVGLSLLLGGLVVTVAPQLAGLLFGHFVLRMKPIILLGALAGAQTVTAAMAALQERSGSPVPVLGYTPAYPLANILLTTWGTISVALMAG